MFIQFEYELDAWKFYLGVYNTFKIGLGLCMKNIKLCIAYTSLKEQLKVL